MTRPTLPSLTSFLPIAATLAVTFLVATAPAAAQQHDPSMHHQHMQHQGSGDASPYTDLTKRTIKALSADEIRGLRAGEGMGFALPAELNGYPGPKHVLELADALELTKDQREKTQAIFDAMAEDARSLGDQLVEAEAHLDRAFVDGSIDRAALDELTAAVASVRGRVRAVHLSAHLDMMDVLTRQQIDHYSKLRGYTAD